MTSNNNGQSKDSKKITTIIVLILTLAFCTTGATYAFFALSKSDNTTITGTAATSTLELTVAQNFPTKTNTGVMVPQRESALGTAMGSTYGCVDGNSNVVCRVYTITIKNTSTAKVVVNGTITFAGSTGMPNLKWRKTTNTTTLGSSTAVSANNTTAWDINAGTACTVSTGNGCTNVSLAKNATATYTIVVWINETGSAQTDTGTYTATVKFEGKGGKGVTSTITG